MSRNEWRMHLQFSSKLQQLSREIVLEDDDDDDDVIKF